MTQEVKGIGVFDFYDNMKDGEGVRVLRKFLREVTINMAKKSTKHMTTVGFPPFVYKEKQIHTIMAPAIDELSDAFLMESPVTRNWSSMVKEKLDDSHGWVDYWCLIKDYNYYIELKHGFISYRSAEIRRTVKNEWEKACNQLNVIQEEINLQKDYARGIFKIVYHVLPIYIGACREEGLTLDIRKLHEIQLKAMEEISKDVPANWSCVWRLNDNIVESYEFKTGFEKYPAVLFLANVSEIVKKD